jgi:hypothetical protein
VPDARAGFGPALAGGRELYARQVLLTTGAVDERPDIEGARERWGRDFLHCPYCHGWEVRDEQLGAPGRRRRWRPRSGAGGRNHDRKRENAMTNRHEPSRPAAISSR